MKFHLKHIRKGTPITVEIHKPHIGLETKRKHCRTMQVPTIRHTEKEEEEPPLPKQRNPSALRSLTEIKRHGGCYRSPLHVRGLTGHPPAVCSPTDNGVGGDYWIK